MIINGKSLLKAAPIQNMQTSKQKFGGVSHGLAEAGYDIRIAQTVKFYPSNWFFHSGIMITGLSDITEKMETYRTSGRFTLASAIEKFQMPNDLVGVVHDKSTWARRGLSVFNTVIEPGWNGYLTLELVFHGNKPVVIEAGQGIAQVLFSKLEEPGDYGNGKYQNQENRPVEARTEHRTLDRKV